MTQETEAWQAGSLGEKLQPLVTPMPGHFRIRWFEARDVIERHEAAWQADRDRLQAEFDKARASERALRRERKGEVWYWQGDEYDHLESLTCPVLIEAGDLREIVGERDRLNDGTGMLRACNKKLQADVVQLTAERNYYIDSLSTARQAIGNLLARIFGDGGHRQQAIGDLTAACAEAESVVLTERQALADLRAGVESVAEALHNRAVTEGRYGNPHRTFQGFADRLTALMAASSAAGAEGAGGAEEEGKP